MPGWELSQQCTSSVALGQNDAKAGLLQDEFSDRIALTQFGRSAVVAYATGNDIVIRSADDLTLVQVLSCEGAVKVVAWSPTSKGMLAAATGTNVEIFEPKTERCKSVDLSGSTDLRLCPYEWTRAAVIETTTRVNCLAWATKCIYLGGEHLSKWVPPDDPEADWKMEWSHPMVSEVRCLAASQDGKYVSTCGSDDRLVKVWYGVSSPVFDPHSYMYLSHPRAVRLMDWRLRWDNNDCGDFTNVLLTVALDQKTRLWAETGSGEETRLYACAMLNPSPGIMGSVRWLVECSSIPVTGGAAIRSPGVMDEIALRMGHPPTFSNSRDWLLGVMPNGSMVIWAVAGLSDQPRGGCTVTIGCEIQKALPSPKCGQISAAFGWYHKTATGGGLDTQGFPTSVGLLASIDGCLTSATLKTNSDELSQISAVSGHSGAVEYLFSHPGQDFPYCASLSSAGDEIVVWKAAEASYANRVTPIEFVDRVITHKCNMLSWTPEKVVLLAAASGGISVYSYADGKMQYLGRFGPGHEEISSDEETSPEADTTKKAGLLYSVSLLKRDRAPLSVPGARGGPGQPDVEWLALRTFTFKRKSMDSSFRALHAFTAETQSATWREEGPSLTWLVVGVGKNLVTGQKSIWIWSLTVSSSGHLEAILRNEQAIDPCKSATFVCSHSETATRSHAAVPARELRYLVTASSDGKLQAYTLDVNDENDTMEFKLTTTMDSKQPGKLCSIKSDKNGFLTTVHEHNGQMSVILWECLTSSFQKYRMEQDILSLWQGIQPRGRLGTALLGLPNGATVLAVSTREQMQLFRPERQSMLNMGTPTRWIHQETLQLPQQANCTSISFLEATGELLIGVGTDIYSAGSRASVETLFSNMVKRSTSLASYHPAHLHDYLLNGSLVCIARALQTLLKAIRKHKDERLSGPVIIDDQPLEAQVNIVEGSEGTPEAPQEEVSDDLFATNRTVASSSVGVNTAMARELSREDLDELSELLGTSSIDGLGPTDQVYLLGIIECYGSQVFESQGPIDEAGGKFLLAYRLFSFLSRMMPPAHRPQSMASVDLAWAIHSESYEGLLEKCFPHPDIDWNQARTVGIGYWLRSKELAARVAERVAKSLYNEKKDPCDCALFYLALGKKSTLVGLLKIAKNQRLYDFFRNDFSEERWQVAAQKNAYVLLGQHRYMLAASMFLLGNRISDCMDALIRSLKDVQLALFICRLLDNQDALRAVVRDHLLPQAEQEGDAALRSIGEWMLGRYRKSAIALLPEVSSSYFTEWKKALTPGVYRYFKFLCDRPNVPEIALVLREEELVYQTAYFLTCAGCTVPALQMLHESGQGVKECEPSAKSKRKKSKDASSVASAATSSQDQVSSGMLDMGAFGGFGMMAPQKPPEPKQAPAAADSGTMSMDMMSQFTGMMGMGMMPPAQPKAQEPPSNPVVEDDDSDDSDAEDSANAVSRGSRPSILHYVAAVNALMRILDDGRRKNILVKGPPSYDHFKNAITVMKERYGLDRLVLCSRLLELCKSVGWIAECAMLQGETDGNSRLCHVDGIIHDIVKVYLATLKRLLHAPAALVKINTLLRACLETARCLLYISDSGMALSAPSLFEAIIALHGCIFLHAWLRKDFLNIPVFLSEWLSLKSMTTGVMGSTSFDVIDTNSVARILEACELLMGSQTQSSEFFTAEEPCTVILRALSFQKYFGFVKDAVDEFTKTKSRSQPDVEERLNDVSNTLEKCSLFIMEELVVTCHSNRDLWSDRSHTNQSMMASLLDESKKLWDSLSASDTLTWVLEMTEPFTSISARGQHGRDVFVSKGELIKCVSVDSTNPFRLVATSSKGPKEFLDDSPKEQPRVRRASQEHLHVHPMTVKFMEFRSPAGGSPKSSGPSFSAECSASHPRLPYYIAGASDGRVALWKFGISDPVVFYRHRGSQSPRITSIHFSGAGNKFGASDVEGYISLWRFGSSAEVLRPIIQMQCHNKKISDFVFLNAGSVVATAGHSSNGNNVAIWDTLMPQQKAMVASFSCHSGGASTIAFSPRRQVLVSGGKKGDICVFDLRKRQLMKTVSAHSMCVSSAAIDSEERYLATGSTHGDIKIWDMDTLSDWDLFGGEPAIEIHNAHEKHRYYQSMSTFGVTRVEWNGESLYSCGADGKVVCRQFD